MTRIYEQSRPPFPAWIAILALLAAPQAVTAQVSSTEPAAVVVFPYLSVDVEGGEDTLVEIANTNVDEELMIRCFLEDKTPGCQATRADPCVPRRPEEDCEDLFCGDEPRGSSFVIRLTPRQPMSWWASQGRDEFPLDGTNSPTTNNDGSNVPAVSSLFRGLLRCVSLDAEGRPTDRNDLIGNATVRRTSEAGATAARYNAIGIPAVEERGDGDLVLTFGGDDPEYAACPQMLELPQVGGGAEIHAAEIASSVNTTLALVTCAQDSPRGSVVQFSVFNEFSQRLSTSRTLAGGQLVRQMTAIDSNIPERSIFSAAVLGTLTTHTRAAGIPMNENGSTGIVAVVLEEYLDEAGQTRSTTAPNVATVSLQRDRELFPLRSPACVGDCNADLDVTVDELMVGVNISLGEGTLDSCFAFDPDLSEKVTVDEVITGIHMGLEGCEVVLPDLPGPPEDEVAPPDLPPSAPGGHINLLVVADADGTKVEPVGTDGSGRPIYERPFGHGFMVVFEARRGTNGESLGSEVFVEQGLPPLQMIVSRDLGDGSEEVCDLTGGVPATDPLVFDSSAALVDAVNDLGCRAEAGAAVSTPCTRLPGTMIDTPLTSTAEVQFCLPIARTWSFPPGETIVAARARDRRGNVGSVAEMVLRVLE